MLLNLDRKGTKSKQGAGHVWVLADEARDEASVSSHQEAWTRRPV
jgi:hypothetical protein